MLTHRARSLVTVLVAASVAPTFTVAFVSADTLSDIKYTDLLARLGASAPTGAGIGIGQCEAVENSTTGAYAPDVTLAEFAGTTFSILSGAAPASSHATEVGRMLYGNTLSCAPGVTNVSAWNVNLWVGAAYLRVGQGATAPAAPPAGVKVFNHSWIGSFGSAANDNDGLRRLDFTVTRDNLFIAAGTNNGAGSVGQPLLSYAYNSVSVGLMNGGHSNSLTPAGIDGQNRRKPDIVAPGAFTSFSTPVVGAAAALLFDTADSHPAIAGNPNANKSLTIKTAMMAGTTHRAAWSNGAATSGPTRGSTITPLDPLYGADLLNVDRAHMIFTAGETNGFSAPNPSSFAIHRGFDYIASAASGSSTFWTFRVHSRVDEASFLASWHRSVITGFTTWTLQDFDLRLWKLVNGVPTSLVGDGGISACSSGNVESLSSVDNVEHLYLRNLASGDYAVELVRIAGTQTALPVVLAWYLPDTVPTPDLDGDGVVGAADLAIMLSQWGSNGLADLNGDRIVDAADLSIFLTAWS